MKNEPNRFWSKVVVDPSTNCWVWVGSRTIRPPYGHLRWDGTVKLAHRVSWELANGKIPAGIFVLHKCDNPPCVNPDHLFLGTNVDNMADMLEKDRGARGEKSGNCKLTDQQVLALRRELTGGASIAYLADKYDITTVYVKELGNFKWRQKPTGVKDWEEVK